MSNKLIYVIGLVILFAGIFTVFATVVNAEGLNFLCLNKQKLIVTLKNDADVEKSKMAISNIPNIKIINIKDRDKEWSKMVNKMDLPNMENPFQNEFTLMINKKENIDEIYKKIKGLDFVEKVEYYSDKLATIEEYQAKYFTIVKRNNVLLNFEDEKALNKDRRELKNLYKKVEKQIKNKEYLAEYKQIKKKYSECEETTTAGMNEFAENNYREVDALLNTVYKKVQSIIPTEDFKNLVVSEQKWLNEVDNYKQAYDSMEIGTIGTVIYYDYQINMKSFRTLLLMLYL